MAVAPEQQRGLRRRALFSRSKTPGPVGPVSVVVRERRMSYRCFGLVLVVSGKGF